VFTSYQKDDILSSVAKGAKLLNCCLELSLWRN